MVCFQLQQVLQRWNVRRAWGFLSNLQTIIGSSNYVKPWIIISNRQKGLEKLVTELIPDASHRRCCRDIFQNFKSQISRVGWKQFWVAARAYNERDFNYAMAIIKDTHTETHAYLVKLGGFILVQDMVLMVRLGVTILPTTQLSHSTIGLVIGEVSQF